ncbi:4-alpha-glucanotransferase [uncultured Clostridium sp.]|uniref:4-alpha-glucanotransferase n=1 Tax=uncultured Clostridium sp. TaxID=59620 RepID=UPI0025CB893F|nr:4-alpha-glucanotransferase [uncultured Clostridium sp.]
MERGSGILMHIASLPGKYGIGTFGKSAYEFCDFLEKSGQKYWQILPLGQTSYGDSPYQAFSAFAGNPYFIDLDILQEKGLLSKEDYENVNFGENPEVIDYGLMFTEKMKILRKAYSNFKIEGNESFKNFELEEEKWLDDYSLFMALKYNFNFISWSSWDEKIKKHDEECLDKYKSELEDEINYWKFIQYEFFGQWKKLKKYANEKDIKIIGDIPIYLANDSADVWSNPKVFLLNEETFDPIKISGCPPDAFSETGQLWGNPIYDWDYLESTGYEWWINRIDASLKLYDVLRIDHFRGFEAYWAVPYGEKTAENGEWVKGPGIKLFNAIKDKLGEIDIIAEDLGYLTQETLDFKKETGFPGMKIIQFAFGSDSRNPYLPHNYERNCVAYTGTHDNDTVRGWLEVSGSEEEVKKAVEYFNLTKEEGYNWGIIRGVWSSVARTSIGVMQDFLNLGNEARINKPSTLASNWSWRAKDDVFTNELAKKIYRLTKIYGRCE